MTMKNNLVDKYFPVLDKGFVALKDYMGDDSSIVRAARVSYGKGTKKVSDDETLIRHLIRNMHTSCVEMVTLCFHVKMPMDCMRQFLRHRTGSLVYCSVNEYSTRYSEVKDEFQTTQLGEWRLQSKSNKQGSEEGKIQFPDYINVDKSGHYLGEYTAEEYCCMSAGTHEENCFKKYKELLDFGIAREQARKILPLSTYTEAYWKIDLHNLFHFLRLRMDSHAQKEIRDYANVIAGIVYEICPLSYKAFHDYVLNSVRFSVEEQSAINSVIDYVAELGITEICDVERAIEDSKLGKREKTEFLDKMKKIMSGKLSHSLPSLDLTKAKTPEDFNND